MSLEVRTVAPSEFPGWMRAVRAGFLTAGGLPSDEVVEDRRADVDLSRVQGVFDGGRCVATFRSFEQRLTVVGGATVASDAITGVTVAPTHRRRGLLSRMMAADLAAAKERGEPVASLIAAEYPIYGRYGFGPAAWTAEWEVSVPRAGLDPRRSGQPADGGRIEMVDGEDVRKAGPEVHAALAARRPGVVSRGERWWRQATGVAPRTPQETWAEPFYVMHRAADGEVDGLMIYGTDDKWGDGNQPQNTASVRDMIALNPAAERALWHYLCSVDWVTAVRSGDRAPDDLLPLLLPDPRAARLVGGSDFLWLRLLDVPRALEARTYAVGASLVLDVRDGAGLAGGRFLLEVAEDGARCVPTTRSADLALGVEELATLYLGDESVRRLADLGRAEELRAGAVTTADAVFRTGRRPWCPDVF
ncbi:GNAT family N-acetyltransferase [Streptomyces californicus]|uniref:GNAT family N-acetyltransferase n=1 Tax=Streptomyces californicus TaxID=67351 RepID=UPI00296F0F90|nr:GNAT family N-acetyltransferase [Streptomyces californicus]MDW4901134.1 GNAT family N-acetyltransferase [Streptomyces californicus]